jgi:glycosyltransferase involved in cell wall biosynthesis
VIKFLRKNKFDILHANSPKAAIPIILSNKRKFLTTIHDFTPFETKLTKFPFEKYLIKLVAKKSTIITTVSNSIRNKFKEFIPNIDLKKIITIYNGIEKKFKPYPRKGEELKRNLGIDGPIILYIGRITPYKGVDYIIKAYKLAKETIPDIKLIIGGTPDFLMEKKYKIWKDTYQDIDFMGYIAEEELPYYYSMADIFINYSSSSEGFGLTPLEALACGTPIICSSIKVYREIFGNYAIYVPPQNPIRLAKTIIKFMKNNHLSEELVINAKKLIKKYTWDEVINRLERIYYNLSVSED